MALKPRAPVFLAIAFIAINLKASSVKCKLTYNVKSEKEKSQSKEATMLASNAEYLSKVRKEFLSKIGMD